MNDDTPHTSGTATYERLSERRTSSYTLIIGGALYPQVQSRLVDRIRFTLDDGSALTFDLADADESPGQSFWTVILILLAVSLAVYVFLTGMFGFLDGLNTMPESSLPFLTGSPFYKIAHAVGLHVAGK